MNISKNIILILPLVILALISIELRAQTMYVQGRDLYTSEGEKVVLRGVNEMFIWSKDRIGESILPEITKTGANSVRLVWTTLGDPHELDQLISNTLKNNMIPMVELHDATGNWEKLQICLDYWKREDIKSIMDKHKKWVLLNIANEAGGKTSADDFKTKYIDAVAQLRKTGYEIPLIIDAANWGQDENNIIETWRDILTSDPKQQIMFSVHTYWTDNALQRLHRFIDKVNTDGIPLIFGEAPQPKVGKDCTVDFPYQEFMMLCQKYEIGWLIWSWGAMNNGDCGSPNSPFDITTDGKYGNWEHPWNEEVVVGNKFSIQNTSIRPASLK